MGQRVLDGPAAGFEATGRRAPTFLRFVQDCGTGKWDVLDALDDTPRENEDVYVYQIVAGTFSQVFIDYRAPGKRHLDGAYQSGEYRHMESVDGNTLRDTETWRAWVAAEAERQGLA
jgi:hypothetical protein